MSKRDLSEADKLAWAAATRHVKPLHAKRTSARPVAAGPAVSSRPAAISGKAVTRTKQPAAPQNRQNERAVRRGRQLISASLDLHGHTQDSAWRVLPVFLLQARAQQARCVIVITGKGRSGEGVLRRNFLHWLETPEAADLVSGYAPAHPKHGGSGAWYVYLRRP